MEVHFLIIVWHPCMNPNSKYKLPQWNFCKFPYITPIDISIQKNVSKCLFTLASIYFIRDQQISISKPAQHINEKTTRNWVLIQTKPKHKKIILGSSHWNQTVIRNKYNGFNNKLNKKIQTLNSHLINNTLSRLWHQLVPPITTIHAGFPLRRPPVVRIHWFLVKTRNAKLVTDPPTPPLTASNTA